MGRKALLLVIVLAALAPAASAQLVARRDPLKIQEPPVYLKSLTSAREKEREAAADLDARKGVEETLRRIGRAFDSGDADVLESCLVTGKRRIYLSLGIDDRKPGTYGPAQVRHILGRLFRNIETSTFSYDSRDIEYFEGVAVVGTDWTYFVLDSDEVVSERLQLKLERVKDDWRIFEIRATSR